MKLPAWSARFIRYCDREGFTQLAVAHAFNIAPSRVHGWRRGAVPREDMRKRIEKWSHGAVPADVDAPGRAA